MSILNTEFIKKKITNNDEEDVKYRWSHGATDLHLGDGLIIYSLIQYMRAKVCVCIGSGGGFIPRIMTQARVDLHKQGIFEGKGTEEWGDIGTTILVDANNGVGGNVDWAEEDSFFRNNFPCRLILDTSENAFYNFFVKEDIKIDYLHIDGDHSYRGVKKDFELYSQILSPNGIISIHDTDKSYYDSYIKTDDIKDEDWQSFDGVNRFVNQLKKKDGWQIIDLFNHNILRNKPSSTGLTIIKKCP